MVLEGEVGIGKTTLLDRVVASAEGGFWRRAHGPPGRVGAPVGVRGAGGPLRELPPDLVHGLPPAQRLALGVVVFRDEVPAGLGRPPDPGHRRAFEPRRCWPRTSPVVLAVDDLPWLDPPSSRILEFVLRRARRRSRRSGRNGADRHGGAGPAAVHGRPGSGSGRSPHRGTTGAPGRSTQLLADRDPSIVSERDEGERDPPLVRRQSVRRPPTPHGPGRRVRIRTRCPSLGVPTRSDG